ncbi:MAG: DUF3667 domain-containing protein [Sphingobacteriales bacterium]|nr:MAG: DUF3667 domain-containing protein [Sphingobacteriales bacterium]
MTVICKNCGVHFKGNYCYNCSQKAGTGRLKLGNVLHELWHNFTHTDRSALTLITALFANPGRVIQEYIEGKRKKFFNPYTFFLVSGAILIFLTGRVFKYEDELYDYRNEFGQALSQYYNIILLCSMPVIALILKAVFLNKKYNYAEWISFLIFSYCIVNVVQVVMQLLYFPLIRWHSSLVGFTDAFAYLIILAIAASFIKPRTFLSWVQCIIAVVLMYICVEIIAKFLYLLWYGVPFKVLLKNYELI